MSQIAPYAIQIAERLTQTRNLEEAGRTLFEGFRPFGARSFFANDSRHVSPTADRPFDTPIFAMDVAGYVGSAENAFVAKHNPVPATINRLRRPVRWREGILAAKVEAPFWEALGAYGLRDGIAAASHVGGNRIGVTIGFADLDWPAVDVRAAEFASYTFLHKVGSFGPAGSAPIRLTPRERDCIAFVAEGKSDWEISVILGISAATAHVHVENAKRKLGANSRAQAVAKFIMQELG